jgi:hypothetical protein
MKLVVTAVLIVGSLVLESKAQDQGVERQFFRGRGGASAGESIGRTYAANHTATLFPPRLPQVVFAYNDNNLHQNYRPEYRRHHGPSQICWEEVVRVERRHGRDREEIRTVCRDRGWRGYHHNHRRDAYRDRDRW